MLGKFVFEVNETLTLSLYMVDPMNSLIDRATLEWFETNPINRSKSLDIYLLLTMGFEINYRTANGSPVVKLGKTNYTYYSGTNLYKKSIDY